MAAMAPMDEQVNDRTDQEKRVGQHAKDVCPVLLPQKERRQSPHADSALLNLRQSGAESTGDAILLSMAGGQ